MVVAAAVAGCQMMVVDAPCCVSTWWRPLLAKWLLLVWLLLVWLLLVWLLLVWLLLVWLLLVLAGYLCAGALACSVCLGAYLAVAPGDAVMVCGV